MTHFNCIHFNCHNKAAQAERKMKKPKTEWEGATIRNSYTKCNNWFPIRGPLTKEDDYQKGIDKYFSSISGICNVSSSDQQKAWILINDLNSLLMKFAKEVNFAKYAQGGTAMHNIKMIPFFIQAISFIFKSQLQAENLKLI